MKGAVIIGCGLIGAKRARALEGAGVPIATLYDTQREAAEVLAASLGKAHVAGSVEEALGEPAVELAVVATSHSSLVPMAAAALAAGIDVLVEKPGGQHLEAIEQLAVAAAEHGRQVRVGFNHRFHPALLKAHELVASGAYGPVMNVRARYGHGGRLGYEKEWRADPSISGGGELLDQGIHLIDLTRYLVGDVELVFSELRTDFWDMQVEDNAFLALRAGSGAFAWLHASWTEWKNLFSFEVAMRTAKLEVSGLGGSYGVERLTLHEMLPEMGPPMTTAWEWPHQDVSWAAEVDDVLRALRGEPAIGASLDDCLAALQVVEEAYRR